MELVSDINPNQGVVFRLPKASARHCLKVTNSKPKPNYGSVCVCARMCVYVRMCARVCVSEKGRGERGMERRKGGRESGREGIFEEGEEEVKRKGKFEEG